MWVMKMRTHGELNCFKRRLSVQCLLRSKPNGTCSYMCIGLQCNAQFCSPTTLPVQGASTAASHAGISCPGGFNNPLTLFSTCSTMPLCCSNLLLHPETARPLQRALWHFCLASTSAAFTTLAHVLWRIEL